MSSCGLNISVRDFNRYLNMDDCKFYYDSLEEDEDAVILHSSTCKPNLNQESTSLCCRIADDTESVEPNIKISKSDEVPDESEFYGDVTAKQLKDLGKIEVLNSAPVVPATKKPNRVVVVNALESLPIRGGGKDKSAIITKSKKEVRQLVEVKTIPPPRKIISGLSKENSYLSKYYARLARLREKELTQGRPATAGASVKSSTPTLSPRLSLDETYEDATNESRCVILSNKPKGITESL